MIIVKMKKILLMIVNTVKYISLIIEDVISLDKRGYTFFNSYRNYRNDSHTYKRDMYMHHFR